MGLFGSILGAIGAVAGAVAGDDGGCDWICDECGAYMNDQPGFTVSYGQWTCAICGYDNDVSEGNVIDYDYSEDDYFGSGDYFRDEERREREWREDMWELGIDPDDEDY